jgi:hypothetical protein
MSKSTAEAVITMEVGGGHPVDMVVELVSHYLDGADIVQAVRRSLKNRKLYRSVGTEVFNVLLRLLTGFDLKVQNVYFRLLSRRQKDLLILDHRFFTSLRFRLPDVRACRVDRVYFDAEDRTGAESTYTFLRLVNLSFHIVLSLISVARLSILLLFGLALAVLIGAWPCIVFVIGFAAVALRACKLWNGRTIAMMDPKEAHVATE